MDTTKLTFKEIDIDKEFIEMAKAEMMKDPKLRPCKMCLHFDETKGFCEFFKHPKKEYNYGAACFITNEVALRALLLQERKRSQIMHAKLMEKMDVMGEMINGASLIHEDITEMVEEEFRRLDVKAKNDDAQYQKNKKHLKQLYKCLSEMKVAMQNFGLAYNRYIGKWNDWMFADENGKYDEENFDRYMANAGFVATMYFALHDVCFENGKNVEDILAFLGSLKGREILTQDDLKRYVIKI